MAPASIRAILDSSKLGKAWRNASSSILAITTWLSLSASSCPSSLRKLSPERRRIKRSTMMCWWTSTMFFLGRTSYACICWSLLGYLRLTCKGVKSNSERTKNINSTHRSSDIPRLCRSCLAISELIKIRHQAPHVCFCIHSSINGTISKLFNSIKLKWAFPFASQLISNTTQPNHHSKFHPVSTSLIPLKTSSF